MFFVCAVNFMTDIVRCYLELNVTSVFCFWFSNVAEEHFCFRTLEKYMVILHHAFRMSEVVF
jgi:hypothetical protein